MSAILNFARFCEWQEGKAEDIDEQFEAVVEQNDELKNSLDQLRREYEVACGDLDDKEAVRTLFPPTPREQPVCQSSCKQNSTHIQLITGSFVQKLLELEQIYADENSKLQSLTLDYQSLANADERADEAAMHAEHQLRAMQAKRESTHKVLEELQSNLCEVSSGYREGGTIYCYTCAIAFEVNATVFKHITARKVSPRYEVSSWPQHHRLCSHWYSDVALVLCHLGVRTFGLCGLEQNIKKRNGDIC